MKSHIFYSYHHPYSLNQFHYVGLPVPEPPKSGNHSKQKEGIAIFFSTNNRDRKGEILADVVVQNIIADNSQNPQ